MSSIVRSLVKNRFLESMGRCRALSVCAVAAFSLLPVGFASAQIEEVVVTAQKREQAITDVPMSISVLSGDAM